MRRSQADRLENDNLVDRVPLAAGVPASYLLGRALHRNYLVITFLYNYLAQITWIGIAHMNWQVT